MKCVIIIANSRYPNGTANSINAFRMVTAFAARGFDVRFLAVRSSLISNHRLWQETCRRYGDTPIVRGSFLWWPFARAAEPALAFFSFFVLLFASRKRLVFTRVSYVALLAAYMGFKTIYESHAPPRGRFDLKIQSLFFRKSNIFVALISQALKNIYDIKGLNFDRMFVLPDAGRVRPNTLPDRESYNGRCKDIGYIGSLYNGRGFEIIIKLALRMPERRFHVIGNIKTSDISVEKCPKNLLLYDELTPHQAELITCLFDILLMPYQKEVRVGNNMNTVDWMSPMKMFEYMLSGKPIISSGLPVLCEVLKNRKNSILVNPDNVQEWEDAICLLDCPDKRYSLSKKAFEEASLFYTWDQRVENIFNYIDW